MRFLLAMKILLVVLDPIQSLLVADSPSWLGAGRLLLRILHKEVW
jgi:hypothetical protein